MSRSTYNELESLMLIPSFIEIDPLVPGNKIFLSIHTMYGHGSHLGHVNIIMLINFLFLVPKNYIQNLVETGRGF